MNILEAVVNPFETAQDAEDGIPQLKPTTGFMRL